MKASKLQRYALIAEIVGAAGIIISLLFVGIEIRRSTVATYVRSYDQLLSDHVQWRMDLATNPETQEAFMAFTSGTGSDDVSSGEEQMGRHAYQAVMQIWERAYFARSYGQLGDEEWERYRKNMCAAREKQNIARIDSRFFSDEYWEYVNGCAVEDAEN